MGGNQTIQEHDPKLTKRQFSVLSLVFSTTILISVLANASDTSTGSHFLGRRCRPVHRKPTRAFRSGLMPSIPAPTRPVPAHHDLVGLLEHNDKRKKVPRLRRRDRKEPMMSRMMVKTGP